MSNFLNDNQDTLPLLQGRPAIEKFLYSSVSIRLETLFVFQKDDHFILASLCVLLYRYIQQERITLAYDTKVMQINLAPLETWNSLINYLQTDQAYFINNSLPRIGFMPAVPDSAYFTLFDVLFYLKEDNLIIHYNRQLYTEKFIDGLVSALTKICLNVSINPNMAYRAIPLADFTEFDKTQVKDTRTLIDLLSPFSQSITAYILTDEASIDFKTLHQKANQVANYLLKINISAGSIVGVYFIRDIKMVIAILAILKVGSAYLPLDPNYPLKHNIAIIEDAKPQLVLGCHIPTDIMAITSCCEYQSHIFDEESTTIVDTKHLPSDPAYLLYTSGSTGKPKGIVITHSNVVAFLAWAKQQYSNLELNHTLFSTSICFDLSIFELFLPLITGNSIILVHSSLDLETNKHKALYQKISLINTVPSAISSLLKSCSIPSSVITINLAGEILQPSIVEQLYQLPSLQKVYNCYGPSETTTYATFYLVPKDFNGKNVPIGQPIAETSLLIVDSMHNPLPIGVPGNIVISGPGLMKGYLNQDELTSSVFINIQEFSYYKTGDIGFLDDQDNLVFLGRSDDQIKLHGYRIQLSYIEHIIMKHGGVKSVIVMKFMLASDEKLVAFIEASDVIKDDLQMFIKAKLPSFMIPAIWVFKEKLPRLPNGKLDRNSLREYSFDMPFVSDVVGMHSTIPKIMMIWKYLLKRDDFKITDNFFDVGGHSLLINSMMLELEKCFSRKLSRVDILSYPTVQDLANYLEGRINKDQHEVYLQTSADHAIAIIGIGMRVPEADSPDEFWENLCNARESIRTLSDVELDQAGIPKKDYQQKNYVKRSALVSEIEFFDHDFFNFSLREAQLLDPQQRLLLESCWNALEDAGYASLEKQRIGVFSSIEMSQYLQNNLQSLLEERGNASSFQVRIANDKDYIAARIAYKLNLYGPAVGIQTACSSSLVAVHIAKQSLLNGECDMALVCAASLHIPQEQGYFYQEGMVASPDGYCRAFDHRAQGTVFGNGAAAVLLSRVSSKTPNDNVYGIIKGSAINNDASNKVSFTAPSREGQIQVIQKAQADANIFSDTIGMVEGHGTGTILGDAIELNALTEVYRRTGVALPSCALGSVKTNIGHLDSAAGLVGLIKAVLSIKYSKIPASLHFEAPNPNHNLENSPFYLPQATIDWPEAPYPRRAAVSSFGIGGTNAHVILEAYQAETSSASVKQNLFVLSAKSLPALVSLAVRYLSWLSLDKSFNLVDLCYTLQVGRVHFKTRIAYEIVSKPELIEKLSRFIKDGVYTMDSVEICQRYVKGETMDWLQLYEMNDRPKRISLPTYAYEKQYCWLDTKAAPTRQKQDLLGERLRLPYSTAIRFETTFSAMFPEYNDHHRLFHQIVVPGSSHLSMFISSIKKAFSDHPFSIQDIYFTEPLLLRDDEQRRLQIIIDTDEKKPISIKLISLIDPSKSEKDEAWVIHAFASIHFYQQPLKQAYIKMTQVQQQCRQSYSGDMFYKDVWVPGVDTGASFHWLDQLWVGEHQALGLIKKPLCIIEHGEAIHAGLIEAGLQLLNACWNDDKEDMQDYIYVPYHMDSLSFSADKLKSGLIRWAYVNIVQSAKEGDSIISEVYLLNELGESVLLILGFKVRKLYQSQLETRVNTRSIFEMAWQEHPIDSRLVIDDYQVNIKQTTQAFWEKSVDVLMMNTYWIDLTAIKTIDIYEANLTVCQRLRHLFQTIGEQDQAREFKLIFIVSEKTSLHYGALLGYIRTARQEFLSLDILYVLVDRLDDKNIQIIQRLQNVNEAKIKDHQVWIPKITKSQVYQNSFISINESASYLITGGAGSLGILMAEWLVLRGAKSIYLIGRSKIPSNALDTLYQHGVEVHYFSVDITEISALKKIDFSKIKGIIHCAGVLNDVSIQHQTDAQLALVLAPKIKGTMNLHELSSPYPLDFFINFSSLSSIIGVAGQSNYAAANAFLDAFAYYRKGLGLPCLTINWGLWKNSKMYESIQDRSMQCTPMTTKEAIDNLVSCHHADIQKIIAKDFIRSSSSSANDDEQLIPGQSVKERLLTIVNKVLGDLSQYIEILDDIGLVEMGLDSLMAIEYRSLIQKTFNIKVSATFAFDYPLLPQAIEYIEQALQKHNERQN